MNRSAFGTTFPPGDFERIDVDIDIIDDAFYLTPLKYKYANKPRATEIPRIERPLTFTKSYMSAFWTQQLVGINQAHPGIVSWSLKPHCSGPSPKGKTRPCARG